MTFFKYLALMASISDPALISMAVIWPFFKKVLMSVQGLPPIPPYGPSTRVVNQRYWGVIRKVYKKQYWTFKFFPLSFFWGGHFEFSKSAILNFFLLHLWEKSSPFIWGIIFFCTMDGFSRILEKKLSELLCTRLYY